MRNETGCFLEKKTFDRNVLFDPGCFAEFARYCYGANSGIMYRAGNFIVLRDDM